MVYPEVIPDFAPAVLCGPQRLLEKFRICVLNSRQSPKLDPADAWIQRSRSALLSLNPETDVFITSLGTTSYDLLTWAAGKIDLDVIIVLTAGSAQNLAVERLQALKQFGLKDHRTLVVRPLKLSKRTSKHADFTLRDRWILALSDRWLPVSIRSGGNLDVLLKEFGNGQIIADFKIAHQSAKRLPAAEPLKPVTLPCDFNYRHYLFHWTRTVQGAWPDETQADYFDRILEKGQLNLSGLETLKHILHEGRLEASGRLIRGGYQVVPFSAADPRLLPQLIRYRAGLRHWTFEPYGIGVKRSVLEAAGARPVIYGKPDVYDKLPEVDKPFFQVAESAGCDWRAEEEWRVPASIDFHRLGKNDMVIFIRKSGEADKTISLTGFHILPLNP